VSSTPTIAAAGGLVWRVRDTAMEVALVHRPRYDDWTLPKGKLEPGESELECAVREVAEELGSQVAVQRRMGRSRYTVCTSAKSVAYWVMRHVDGGFAANREVDRVAWLRPGRARKQLSYDVDRAVLADFASVPVPDSIIVLLRHAKAGKRSQWSGADSLRPLDPAGRRQAAALIPLLVHFAPTRILAAAPARCVQTVEPLAHKLRLPVEIVGAFGDESYVRAPGATQTALFSLAKPGTVSVVCSQGVTIPSLLDTVVPALATTDTRKADCWVLSIVDGEVLAADHYDAPAH
jgi:8-oxo-(d)GTP phosphatase